MVKPITPKITAEMPRPHAAKQKKAFEQVKSIYNEFLTKKKKFEETIKKVIRNPDELKKKAAAKNIKASSFNNAEKIMVSFLVNQAEKDIQKNTSGNSPATKGLNSKPRMRI